MPLLLSTIGGIDLKLGYQNLVEKMGADLSYEGRGRTCLSRDKILRGFSKEILGVI